MHNKLVPLVKSPSRKSHYHLKKAKGFSLAEIKKSGKVLNDLKELGINIDYFRRTSYDSNVKQLKAIKVSKSKSEKREPFVKKEKKRTPFKPNAPAKKKKTPKTTIKKKLKTATKPKVLPKEKTPKVEKEEIVEKQPKIESKTPKKESTIPKETVTPLTSLTGLGATTAKKFETVGISCVEELCESDADETAKLIKGASVTRIETWIKEGKKILEDSK